MLGVHAELSTSNPNFSKVDVKNLDLQIQQLPMSPMHQDYKNSSIS
jgi:hypothetical protein